MAKLEGVFKEEYDRIKKILAKEVEPKDVHNALEVLYERISDREKDFYERTKYNMYDIIVNSADIKELQKNYKGKRSVLIEFLKVDKVPENIVIIYNEYKGMFWANVGVYVLRV